MWDREVRAAGLVVRMTVAGAWVVMELGGELDCATVPQLRGELDLAGLMRIPPLVLLELSELSFCDSAGLGLLVETWTRLRALGGDIALVRPGPQLMRRLRWTGLADHFNVWSALPGDPAG